MFSKIASSRDIRGISGKRIGRITHIRSTPPPLLSVNRESRYESLNYYTILSSHTIFPDPPGYLREHIASKIYLNPANDTIVVKEMAFYDFTCALRVSPPLIQRIRVAQTNGDLKFEFASYFIQELARERSLAALTEAHVELMPEDGSIDLLIREWETQEHKRPEWKGPEIFVARCGGQILCERGREKSWLRYD